MTDPEPRILECPEPTSRHPSHALCFQESQEQDTPVSRRMFWSLPLHLLLNILHKEVSHRLEARVDFVSWIWDIFW